MSSDSSDSDSSPSGSGSSGSESSGAKKKRQKKEKKQLKKLKKKEKKLAKKEKKAAKKEAKNAKKEAKTDKKRKPDGDDSNNGREAPKKKRRSRSRSRSPKPSGGRGERCASGGSTLAKGALADVCEKAALGMKDKGGSTVKDDDITVHGPSGDLVKRPDVFKTFEEIREFPREVQAALKNAGFPGPSQIQQYCWPLGLDGKDVIGIAATGSGKTLAFLLPAFIEMDREGYRPERDGPGLVVMSPTRELAQQTETEASKFGSTLRMRSVAMYGGAPKGQQMSKYRAGCHCIVACPGRLNDFLEGGQVRLKNAARLVLDEADRMLDMGFEPQIRKIIATMPSKRHTMFFTATWPKEIRQLASEILHKPYKVMIGNREELKGNQDVTQMVRIVSSHGKLDALGSILQEAGLTRSGSVGKALVFCGTKKMCDQLSYGLTGCGVICAAIHGDKDQQERDKALEGLKNGRVKVLVATDVAARGLDIKGVGLVVNYDPAGNAEDYVHRIGRTGRAGAKGFAITMLTSADGSKAKGIMEVMERTGQHISEELEDLARSGGGGGGGRKGGGKGKSKGGMMALGM